jgi:two-component system, NarL family, nitrate/nitrite response regulator NarL
VSEPEAVRLVQGGVAGIFHKHNPPEALCRAIRQVVAGEVCLEANYLKPLFRTVDQTRPSGEVILSDRDKAILRYVFQGLGNKEIGGRIDLSEGAVKACLRQLFQKLGVHTRAQLVKVAIEQYRDQL